MDNIKYISKEIWFEHAKQYIIEYIAHHLYNGEKIPTYESSCDWYYNTFTV